MPRMRLLEFMVFDKALIAGKPLPDVLDLPGRLRASRADLFERKLIHRIADDMHRLFSLSRFGCSADAIHFEKQGISLFAEIRKR